MAYGWGWSEKKLDKSTIKFIFQTWVGKISEVENRERREWERVRMLGYWVVSPYSKNITPKKLLPFSWEKETVKVDIEEQREIWNKLRNVKQPDKRTNNG